MIHRKYFAIRNVYFLIFTFVNKIPKMNPGVTETLNNVLTFQSQ